jgi:type IX secretion system PorP/SprF family membrane protein
MKTKFNILGLLAATWSATTFAQQDKHLSMWNENASCINPAAVASMDEDIRFLTNFRMQWLPLNGNALRTNAFSFDAKLMKDKKTGSHLGMGINFTNDQTGDIRYTSNVVSVPVAYTIGLDKNSLFSIGIAPGFVSRSIGTGNQTWDNQWNGSSFDQTIGSGEVINASASSFDLGAGLHYKYQTNGQSHFKIGFGVNHLTSPSLSFTSTEDKLYRNINFYASGTYFQPKRKLGISPSLLVSLMGPNYNILVGTTINHELFESSNRTNYIQRSFLSYGLFFRWKDAMVATLAYKIYGFKFGVSYDINVSSLNSDTRSQGGFELFLRYSLMVD